MEKLMHLVVTVPATMLGWAAIRRAEARDNLGQMTFAERVRQLAGCF
jgi:hypothetical protein